MDAKGLKIGIMAPGEFRRIAIHAGAFRALIANGFPRPVRMVTGSVGALIGTPMATWNLKAADNVVRVVENLSYRQIFTVPMGSVITGTSAAVAATFPLWSHFEPEMKPRTKAIVHGLQTLGIIVLGYWFFKKLMKSSSIFSNHPLYNLLMRTTDYDSIVGSDVEVIITMTDIQTGDELILSTHDKDITPERLLAARIGSSTVPVYFPVGLFDGHIVTDAEVKSDFPVHHLEDMDIIFRLSYSLVPDPYPTSDTWGDHFNGMWAISKRENTILRKDKYEQRRKENPDLPEVVEILTDRQLPRLAMETFNQKGLSHSVQLGEQIIEENRELIKQKMAEALARKKARS